MPETSGLAYCVFESCAGLSCPFLAPPRSISHCTSSGIDMTQERWFWQQIARVEYKTVFPRKEDTV